MLLMFWRLQICKQQMVLEFWRVGFVRGWFLGNWRGKFIGGGRGLVIGRFDVYNEKVDITSTIISINETPIHFITISDSN